MRSNYIARTTTLFLTSAEMICSYSSVYRVPQPTHASVHKVTMRAITHLSLQRFGHLQIVNPRQAVVKPN